MTSSFNRTIFVALFAIFALIVLLPLLRPLFQSSEERAAIRQYREHRASVQSAWNNASYLDVDFSDEFDQAVDSRIRSQASIHALNERQQASLVSTVGKYIRAYSRLGWDQFKAFRLPLGEESTVFDPQRLSRYRQALPSKSAFEEGMQAPPEESEEFLSAKPDVPFYNTRTPWNLFRTYWGIFVRHAYNVESGKPEFCCWSSVALEHLQLSVEGISAGPSPRSLDFQASTNAVPAVFSVARSVRYRPSLEELLDRGKKVTAATISLLVKDGHNPDPYPVHLGLYWHPTHGRWLPFALETVGNPRLTMDYFF